MTLAHPLKVVAWELTGACNLHCTHCRASAGAAAEDELTTQEALSFIDSLAPYRPLLIMTGGEPLMRADLFELLAHAQKLGIHCALSTNGTLLTPELARQIRRSGIRRVSISVDGAKAATHDTIRGVGMFEKALEGARHILDAGLELQINTTLTKENIHERAGILELALGLGARALHVFMLVPTGRAKDECEVSPLQYEDTLHWLYEMARQHPEIEIRPTCAPHYVRVVHEMENVVPPRRAGCLGGVSYCFVSRSGDVFPCGYLPLVAGSIRESSIEEIWEHSPVFSALRNPDALHGKCGGCEYRVACGGCRARAYALTGDVLASEPFCTYTPNPTHTEPIHVEK
ncbi:MAG: radical SAM protein [Methermicoccaceae archaeon]